VVLIVVIALSITSADFRCSTGNEGRNARGGARDGATNDYVMPRLDGLPYLDKPIIYSLSEPR